jgi:hypothetical protein
MRPMKARLLLAALVAVLAGAAPAAAAERVVERGIVQSIDPSVVVLRALDGTDVAIRLGPATRFRLNGAPATLEDIRPGLVAEVVTVGSRPAIVIRAFGDVGRASVRGVLLRVGQHALLLRRPSGRSVRIPIGARTTVWRGGTRVRLGALRPGMHVDAYRAAGGMARVVVIRAPAP